jgi:hypothetical protein
MKPNAMLTVASLVSLLLLTFHMAGDIKYGYEPGGLANLVVTVIIAGIWLWGVSLLHEKRSGHIIMLLGGLMSMFVPYVHMKGKGVGIASRMVGTSGHFFFVWTLIAMGVLGFFTVILAARGLWGFSWRKSG